MRQGKAKLRTYIMLLGKAKQSYIYQSSLKYFITSPVLAPKQLCALHSRPTMCPRSGYFLCESKNIELFLPYDVLSEKIQYKGWDITKYSHNDFDILDTVFQILTSFNSLVQFFNLYCDNHGCQFFTSHFLTVMEPF